jgi:hypothetical protein
MNPDSHPRHFYNRACQVYRRLIAKRTTYQWVEFPASHLEYVIIEVSASSTVVFCARIEGKKDTKIAKMIIGGILDTGSRTVGLSLRGLQHSWIAIPGKALLWRHFLTRSAYVTRRSTVWVFLADCGIRGGDGYQEKDVTPGNDRHAAYNELNLGAR